MKKWLHLLVSAALVLSASLTLAAEGEWGFLPARVLEIEGGAISFRGALIVDTSEPLGNPIFEKYPTKYWLVVTNESDFPVWIDFEWRVPGEKPFPMSSPFPPGFFRPSWVKVKTVLWDKPIPVQVTVYRDEEKTRVVAEREVVLSFSAEDEVHYKRLAKEVNRLGAKTAAAHGRRVQMPILSGFQEMDLTQPVPGTAADKQLIEDIKLVLWKTQSRRHWDCTHEVLDARRLPPEEARLGSLGAEQRKLVEESLAKGEVNLEEWRVRSCDSVSTYLVAMLASPAGGTDVMAVKLETEEQPSGGAPAPPEEASAP